MTDQAVNQDASAEEYIQQLETERDQLVEQIDALNKDLEAMVTEARGVAWSDFYGWTTDKNGQPRQVKISLTCRSARSGLDAAQQLLHAASELKHKNIFPYMTDRPGGQPSAPQPTQTQAPASAPVAPPTATQAPQTQAPATPAPAPQNQGNGKSGTGRLKSITVDAGLKVSFEVDGLRWPLKDARQAGVIVKLFDPELGWTEQHFQSPAVYTETHFGTIFLDWQQEGKYYNVKRIHA